MTTPVIAPLVSENKADALGKVTGKSSARQMVEAHMFGLRARRQRDLLSEKYLLHCDGSGDLQWADIFNGTTVEIPRLVSDFRKTENLLRPIVDNAVAHHTTMPLRFFADSSPDRKARDKALVDAIWANYLADQQDLNGLLAEALYIAMPAGFCPIHAYWREDRNDSAEPITASYNGGQELSPGMIDCFVGNPFDTVFDRTARKDSVYWCSYGRLVPAGMVRRMFPEQAKNLEGSTKIPSAALFQRIARDWMKGGLGVHGSPVIEQRQDYKGDDEMMVLLCREVLPGYEADWPQGRLQIVAVPGEADFRRQQGKSSNAVTLYDNALPAGDFSWSLIYSHQRGDDVLGKPWVEDLDQLQVDLNIAESKAWEHINKMAEAPIVGPGGALAEDMSDIGGYNYMEIEPSLASWRPRVMEWPDGVLNGLEKIAENKRKALYTIGGYQAASRGESPGSRTAYRTILALQQADNTIHGPVNARFRKSACEFMSKRCWKQMKVYGSVPWLVDIVGDEYSYLVEPYINNDSLSDSPPKYKLVNAFGSNPELKAQEVLDLMVLKGADGQVFLTTDEARRQYPNHMIFDSQGDPKAVSKRRARTVAVQIHSLAAQAREQFQIENEAEIMDPRIQQAAMQVLQQVERQFPRFRDDNIEANISTLSEIIQDETSDPIARLASVRRQALYYEVQAQMAGQIAVAPGMAQRPATPQSKPPLHTNQPNRLQVARATPNSPTPQQPAAGVSSPTPLQAASQGVPNA
jgi:hypothetical protein